MVVQLRITTGSLGSIIKSGHHISMGDLPKIEEVIKNLCFFLMNIFCINWISFMRSLNDIIALKQFDITRFRYNLIGFIFEVLLSLPYEWIPGLTNNRYIIFSMLRIVPSWISLFMYGSSWHSYLIVALTHFFYGCFIDSCVNTGDGDLQKSVWFKMLINSSLQLCMIWASFKEQGNDIRIIYSFTILCAIITYIIFSEIECVIFLRTVLTDLSCLKVIFVHTILACLSLIFIRLNNQPAPLLN